MNITASIMAKGSLFVINNPKAPRLSPELAVEIGLNESILLLQLEYWIRISKTEEREGKRWTYQSTTELCEHFPFWGRATINRIIKNLVEADLIFVMRFNKHRYDKTRWFALNPKGIEKLRSVTLADGYPAQFDSDQFDSDQNGTGSAQFGTTIPETSTETSFNTKKEKINKKEKFQLPDWIDKETWYAFIEMRKSIRAVPTERAKELLVKKLEALQESGENANEVLNQSIMNNWKGLFTVKEGRNNGRVPESRLTAEEVYRRDYEAAERAIQATR